MTIPFSPGLSRVKPCARWRSTPSPTTIHGANVMGHLATIRRFVQGSTLLLAASMLAGCYKATFVNPSVPPGPQIERWTHFYLFGLAGHEELDVRLLCPGEVASIRTGGNVATELVTAVTLGIYAPRKVYVTCSGAGPKPPAGVEPSPATDPAPGLRPILAPDASAQAARSAAPPGERP